MEKHSETSNPGTCSQGATGFVGPGCPGSPSLQCLYPRKHGVPAPPSHCRDRLPLTASWAKVGTGGLAGRTCELPQYFSAEETGGRPTQPLNQPLDSVIPTAARKTTGRPALCPDPIQGPHGHPSLEGSWSHISCTSSH